MSLIILRPREHVKKQLKKNPWLLEHLPDNLETQGMCEGTVKKCSGILGLVLDWFVTQGQVKVWHDHNYYCNNDKLIEWYEDLQKRKAQKTKKKKNTCPLPGTHQDGVIGVFLRMRRKKQKQTVGIKMDLSVSGDRTQKLLGLKELQIKMSSVMPLTFNAVILCVVTINEKPWTRAREVCRALEYGKATKTADVVRHL